MGEPTTQRSNLRSIGALFAGFVAVVILSIGTDMVLHATGVFPPPGRTMSDALFLLATAYRTVYGIAGGYLTARLAPRRPMLHALVGGGIGTAIATLGAILTWNQPEFGPHWYPLTLVALGMPTAWAGGKLRTAQGEFHGPDKTRITDRASQRNPYRAPPRL